MMYEVKSIIRPERVAAVVRALHEIPDVPGLTISVVRGIGRRTPAASSTSAEFGETEIRIELPLLLPEIPDARDACVRRLRELLSRRRGITTMQVVEGDGRVDRVRGLLLFADDHDGPSEGTTRRTAVEAIGPQRHPRTAPTCAAT